MKKSPQNFEDALNRLESIISEIQNTQTPLEEALKKYEEGKKLLTFCHEKLNKVEQKLQILDQDDLKDFQLDISGNVSNDEDDNTL